MKPNELDRLIDDCLEGCLSEADAARLSSLMEESPEARARYWEAATVHGLLESSLQQASLRVITGEAGRESGKLVRWWQWRPLATAAAAGLMFGILSASMVWAYAVPLTGRALEHSVAILAEGFEDTELKPGRGFPTSANHWSGDVSEPVGAVADVRPSEGKHMVRLIPVPKRKFSYAWRIVDLSEHPVAAASGALRLEVAASFNSPDPAQSSRYQIRLAAFSEAPAEVRDIWNNEPVLFDTVLQHAGRNVRTKPRDSGWQTVKAALQIPPGTRSVVISLAASDADPAEPLTEHYLDDVQTRFVLTPAPAE